MARVVLLLAVLFALPVRADEAAWHRVVGLLEYLEGDYGKALATHDAAELEEQRGFAEEIVTQLKTMGAPARPYLERATALQRTIDAAGDAETVTAQARALTVALISEQHLVQAPRHTPSLAEGQQAFEANCASCHGATGHADTALAKQLEPPPADFHDAARMQTLTPYKVFNTSTFGIKGTAMPGFATLPEATRWNLAFTVLRLRQPACVGAAPEISLDELATSTDVQLAERYGQAAVPCLRQVLPERKKGASLDAAQAGLDDALLKYAQGDVDGARQAVIDAYLDGLEPVEPMLRARDPQLVARLEAAFTRTRLAAQRRDHFEAEAMSVKVLLAEAARGPQRSTFWSVFVTAILILLREGFEAVVVVGALLAVLKKMKAEQQVRVVHAAWISALVVGALAFAFGQVFFAGANREWLEAVVSLVAVGLLLYAALWLNARATMSRFMGELRGKMTDAITTGSTLSLFLIAFSSVARESIETALFLEGLAIDSRSGATWGALAGLVAVAGLVVMVRTVGFRLPMKTLFSASTVLLVVTAVMLLGKGLHGLQELGVVPLAPFPFVTVDALGLYGDVWSLLPQVGLAALAVAWRFLRARPARPGEDVTHSSGMTPS